MTKSSLGSLAALAFLAGCSASHGTIGKTEGAWGALNDAELVPTSPQYLINKSRGESFRVCLPQYMADMFPGVENEIVASVNLWGAALGRSIPVDVQRRDLPRATANQSVDDLA